MTLPAKIPKSELDLTYHNLSTLDLVNKLYSTGRDIAALEEDLAPRYFALGQLMAAAKQDPEFLATAGFERFGDFESHLLKETGLFRSPSSLWVWKKISERLPALTSDQLTAIPARSLYLIANSVQDRAREEMLALAPSVTYEGLKSAAEEAGYLGAAPTEDGGANLILTGSKEQIAEITCFLEEPTVVRHVGTANKLEILLAMMQECAIEWTSDA